MSYVVARTLRIDIQSSQNFLIISEKDYIEGGRYTFDIAFFNKLFIILYKHIYTHNTDVNRFKVLIENNSYTRPQK